MGGVALKKFMVIAKEYNFIKIIGFSLLCLTLWALPIVTMAETNTDSFYGSQSLNSIVDGEKMTLTLPGGAKVAMENQENAYTVPDHTQSTRLAVEADNTVSEPIAYTPFGDNQASLTESYTGMTFEPETATYDYHARRYDPTVARFIGVDAIRQSISPYSYTENNPINFVDLNGLGRTLYLYSLYGKYTESNGDKIVEPMGKKFKQLIQELKLPISNAPLEYAKPLKPSDAKEITHLTIDAHGMVKQQRVGLFSLEADKTTFITSAQFADYLHRQLQVIAPEAIQEVKSICLFICGADHHPAKPGSSDLSFAPSFADGFTDVAKHIFPKLENVVASPYMIATHYNSGEVEGKPKDEMRLGFSRVEEGENYEHAFDYHRMKVVNVLEGQYPHELFNIPAHNDTTRIYNLQRDGAGKIVGVTSPIHQSNSDFYRFGFDKPAFNRIQVRSPSLE